MNKIERGLEISIFFPLLNWGEKYSSLSRKIQNFKLEKIKIFKYIKIVFVNSIKNT